VRIGSPLDASRLLSRTQLLQQHLGVLQAAVSKPPVNQLRVSANIARACSDCWRGTYARILVFTFRRHSPPTLAPYELGNAPA
jgi:hypothetical protein